MLCEPVVFEARDGVVLRLRVPGGRLGADEVGRVAVAAGSASEVYVTSRGNVQLRGVGEVGWSGSRVGCDVVASPLSEEAAHLARRLAVALGDVVLPSRALVGVDSGVGDVASLRLTLGLRLVDGGVSLLGEDGVLSVDEGVAAVVDRARAGRFLPDRPVPWSGPPVGWLERADGLVDLGAGAPLGLLPGRVLEVLAATGCEVSFTPWQSVVVHGVEPAAADVVVRVLAPMGLIFDAGSSWLDVSSCVGAPGCGRALSAVREDAAQVAQSGAEGRVHFMGCARGCGRPHGPHTGYWAVGDGEYEVGQRGM